MTKEKLISIPKIRHGEFIVQESDTHTDIFYGVHSVTKLNFKVITNQYDLMLSEVKKHDNIGSFEILHDFKKNTNMENKEWYYVDNIMVYENKYFSPGCGIVHPGVSNTDNNTLIMTSYHEVVFWARIVK